MFAAGLPFVAVDPVGSWYGLRSSADGKTAGLPIPIFGGKHGDVPLERGAGELLADLVVDKRLTCVLDLSRFESESAKKQFLLAFAQRLYLKNENPLHLFLEEADDYIPQKPMRDEAQLLRAWENIVRRGRARGLGMTLITQRSASTNKMVLTQVETLFAMRTTGPQDIAAIEAWVKYHQAGQEVLSTLAALEDGEAWVWSPHFLKTMARHQIRRRHTFDSGATPANVHAKDKRPPATLADIDLSSIQTQMAATIEKAKADDPRELKKQIAGLQQQLAVEQKKFQTGTKSVPGKEKPVLTESDRAFLRSLDGRLSDTMDAIAEKADLMLNSIAERAKEEIERAASGWLAETAKSREKFFEMVNGTRFQKILGKLATIQPAQPTMTASPRSSLARRVAPASAPATSRRPARQVSAEDNGHLGKGERIVLVAIAQYPDGVTREQLSILSGYKRSTRDAYVQRLAVAGHVDVGGDTLRATDAGVAILGDFEPLPTGAALLTYWLNRLPSGEKITLEAVVDGYPQAVDRDAISEQTGYKRSTRDAYIQRLQARRLVSTVRDGVKASKELFS